MNIKKIICLLVVSIFFVSLNCNDGNGSAPEPECITPGDAINHIGQYASVRGKVYEVHHSTKSDTVFLNLGAFYPQSPFTAVIFKSALPKFSNVFKYEGKIVKITGMIKSYNGKAEIIINSPTQISY